MKYIHEVDDLMHELIEKMQRYLDELAILKVQHAYQHIKTTTRNQRNEKGELYLEKKILALSILVDLQLDEATLTATLEPDASLQKQIQTITHLIDQLSKSPTPYPALLNQLLDTRSDTTAYLILFAHQLVTPEPQAIESYYLPMARQLNANFFVSEFEEYCFAHANPDVYAKLTQQYDEEMTLQQHDIQQLEQLLGPALVRIPTRMNEIYYAVTNTISKIYYVKIPYQSQEIPLTNYIFQIAEHLEKPIAFFFDIYQSVLHPQGYLWLGQGHDETHLRRYVLLQDRHHNTYRLFLMSPNERHHYNLGLHQPENIPSDALTIYDLEGHVTYLPAEATILDYAFALDPAIGYHMYAFTLNHQYLRLEDIFKQEKGALLTLHQGDRVQVYHDLATPTAKMEWFKWVHTTKAQNALISYFQSKLKE